MVIRVFLADDHGIVRGGIRAMLEAEDDLEVVGEASDGRSALERIQFLRPDIAVLDVQMPYVNGFQAVERLRRISPKTRAILLSMFTDSKHVRAGIEAGAAGYVIKGAVPSELITAIHAVSEGKSFVSTPSTEAEAPQSPGPPLETAGLSDREAEVLKLLAYGYTNPEIGQSLNVSERTVATYRARLTDKLGLKTRAEVVRYALSHGLLS